MSLKSLLSWKAGENMAKCYKETVNSAEKAAKVKKKNPHAGHRQNVRNRYYKEGLESMPDHNVLEMLLFFGIPQKDTNELAHELIEHFGSFTGVLEADMNDLRNIKGMTENAACLITMLLPIYRRYAQSLVDDKRPILSSAKDIYEYIKPRYIGVNHELVYALGFDGNHRLIADRLICDGDLDSASFNLRSVASFALETNARSIVLIHNHCNEVSAPSNDDINATLAIRAMLNSLSVSLSDHVIVADSNYTSIANIKKYAYIFYDIENIFE